MLLNQLIKLSLVSLVFKKIFSKNVRGGGREGELVYEQD